MRALDRIYKLLRINARHFILRLSLGFISTGIPPKLRFPEEQAHFVNFLPTHFGDVPNSLGHFIAIVKEYPLFLFHFDSVPGPLVHLLGLEADLLCYFLHELS